MYVEAQFTFQDYQITVDGQDYYVSGETLIYSDDEDADYEFDPAEVTFAQRVSDLEEIDPETLPYVAMMAAVHAKIDVDPYVLEVLERERMSWMG